MPNHWITTILLLGVAVIGSNSLVLSPILTDVATDLGTTSVAVARSMAAYGGATALSALFLAPAIDRYGPRIILLLGGLCLTVAMIGSALSPSWTLLALAQAMAGLAAGVMLPAIYAVATTTGSEKEGVRILGRVLVGWSVSLIAGVPLSALIADSFGWRVSFLSLAALVAASLVGFRLLPRPSRDTAPKPAGRFLGAVGIPGIAALLAAQFFFMTAFYGTYAFFGDHLRTSLELTVRMAGLAVLTYGIGFGIAAFADPVVDRLGPARILPFAMLFVAAVYFILPVMVTWLAGALAAAFIWGFANHFVLNTLVLRLSQLGGRQRGTVLGLNSAVTYFGALAGALILGDVYGHWGFRGLTWAAGASVLLALPAVLSVGRHAGGANRCGESNRGGVDITAAPRGDPAAKRVRTNRNQV
ncbi:MFS transporter [uncultured Roseobacter sp.]|uniref:MFS transporter n=1 Tax=uncultured Roseobacter sp. TaxID=114847 RepID=UPI00262F8BD3|nr:MFS transporter [uncultured Roseobacter sp.]